VPRDHGSSRGKPAAVKFPVVMNTSFTGVGVVSSSPEVGSEELTVVAPAREMGLSRLLERGEVLEAAGHGLQNVRNDTRKSSTEISAAWTYDFGSGLAR
jgi:hypothetical protein